MRFILRFRPEVLAWFDSYASYNQIATGIDRDWKVNALLLEGYKHPHEDEFVGSKAFPPRARGSEAGHVYKHMLAFAKYTATGKAPEERTDRILAGMAEKWPERMAWWRAPKGLALGSKAGPSAPASSDGEGDED
jgi:hypothetical protein